MKRGKKILKKVNGLFLAVAMFFSNIVPFIPTSVFALTQEEKNELIAINMRGADAIEIEGDEAVIRYPHGDIRVNGDDLAAEEREWDYGDGKWGTMQVLYTSPAECNPVFRGVVYDRLNDPDTDIRSRVRNFRFSFSRIALGRLHDVRYAGLRMVREEMEVMGGRPCSGYESEANCQDEMYKFFHITSPPL